MKVFIDTNILIYAMDEDEPAKRDRCRELLTSLSIAPHSPQGVLSTQVLQETFVASTRKLGVEPLKARGVLQSLQALEIVTITPELIFTAIECSHFDQLSFWDALIVTAAVYAGCDVIWTEDLNAGQLIRGVRIKNPLL